MHDIVEIDEFTTPIVVPDGVDDRHDAAEVVAAIAQVLGNRTVNLQLHGALFDGPNTFTEEQIFAALVQLQQGARAYASIENYDADSSRAALVTRLTTADDSHSGNKWKAVLSFNIGGSAGYVNVYVGTRSGPAQFIVTLNAVWNTATQNWTKDDGTLASFAALYETAGTLTLSQIAPGGGPWTVWPVSSSAKLQAGEVDTSGNVVAGGNIFATGDVSGVNANFTGDVHAGTSNLFRYGPGSGVTRTVIVPIAACYGDVFRDGVNGAVGSSTGGFIAWNLRLPSGSTINSVEVIGFQNGTNPSQLRLTKRSGHNWTSGNQVTETFINTTPTPSVTGYYHITIAGAATLVDNANNEYQVHFTRGQVNDEVQGIRVTYQDPGPRSH